MSLTAQQREAVDYPGNLLLQACPGSGKTRTIVARLVKEVEALRDTPFAAACITYTNSAVLELEERVGDLLQPGDDRSYIISTIHAFCLNEILRPFAARMPDFNGAMKVLTRDRPEFEQIANHAAAKVNWHNLTIWDYEGFGNLNLDASGRLIGVALDNEQLKRAAPHFWTRCRELGFVDFPNIIYRSYCLLRDDAEIARSVATRFKVFLIDEFQDTTELQIEILKLVHRQKRSRFFLVGDPAQSIFGFTGARPELIDPFAKEIAARMDLSLSGNFRSSPAIVQQANRLFPRRPPMTSEGEAKTCAQPAVYRHVDSTFDALTEEFLPLLADLKIPFGRAAVLARNWILLYPLARKLREFDIPVVGPGARPYRRSRLFATLAEQLCGAVMDREAYSIRQLELAVFHAVQDITGHRRAEIFSFAGRLAVVRLLREAEALAKGHGAAAWLDEMSERTGDLIATNGWIDEGQAGLFRASVEDMKADMRERKENIPNLSIEDLGMFASPDKAMRLLTIHNAKGHEYEAVALIGARERTLPDYRSMDAAGIASEKRLFYVGVTRAERLLMYIFERDSWGNPPSRFLGTSGVNII